MRARIAIAAVAVNACLPHEDQLVAETPHVQSVAIFPETDATATRSMRKDEARQQTRAEILDACERWAGASMRFGFSSRSSRSDTCFDQSDGEVACSNPNAHRQETQFREDVSSTVANLTDAALSCRALDATSNPQAGISVLSKATHSFSTSATHGTTADAKPWVVLRCEVALKDAVKLAALPADTAEMTNTKEPLVGVEVSYAGSAEIMTYVLVIGDKRFVHEGDEFREVR